MSSFYEWVGRLVIGFVRRRYGRQLRVGAAVGAGIGALAAAAYLASRDGDDEA